MIERPAVRTVFLAPLARLAPLGLLGLLVVLGLARPSHAASPPPVAEQPRCPPAELSAALLDLFPPAPLGKRMEAARALGACGGRRTIGPLGAALAHDPEVQVRAQVARVLGSFPHPTAVAALKRALRAEEPPALQAAVLSALDQLGETEPIKQSLASSGDDGVRALALSLLATADAAPDDATLSRLAEGAGPELRKGIARVRGQRAAGEAAQAKEVERQRRAEAMDPLAAAETERRLGARPPGAPATPNTAAAGAPVDLPAAAPARDAPAVGAAMPTPASSPPRVVDGTPLAVTTSMVAGGVWGSSLSLLAQQDSVGVVTLLGTAGAVIGGGTALGLTRFGVRPTTGQALFYANATAWGTLAGLAAWAGSGSESLKLKYGLIVGGETLGIAAGLWGGRAFAWRPGQVLLANSMVAATGVGALGVRRIHDPDARFTITPAVGYGTAPVMLATLVAARYVDPSADDWRLAFATSAAAGWTGLLVGGGVAGDPSFGNANGHGAALAGVGFGYLAATGLGPFVEVPPLALGKAAAGMLAGNAIGLGTHMVVSPEDDSRWKLSAGVAGAGLGVTAALFHRRLRAGASAAPMAVAGLIYGTAAWRAAMAANGESRLDAGEPLAGVDRARVMGGMLALGTAGAVGGYLASRGFSPSREDYPTSAAFMATGAAAGLGLAKLTTDERGTPDAIGVLGGAGLGLAGGATFAHYKRLRRPDVEGGLVGGAYGLLFGTLAPTLTMDTWEDSRATAGGAWLGLAAGASGGLALARGLDATQGQVAVPSTAGLFGLGVGVGAGLAFPGEVSQAARVGAVAGAGSFITASLLVEPRLRLGDGLGRSALGMFVAGGLAGAAEGLLLGQLIAPDDAHWDTTRRRGGAFLAGASAGMASGLVLSKRFTPSGDDYFTALGVGTLGGVFGSGVAHLALDGESVGSEQKATALTLAGSSAGLVGGALVAHYVPVRQSAFAAAVAGGGAGALVGTLIPSLDDRDFRYERGEMGGARLGLAVGSLGAATAAQLTGASSRQVLVPTFAAGLGVLAGVGAGMLSGDESSHTGRVATVAGTLGFGGGALIANHWLRLDEGLGPSAPGIVMVGTVLGQANGAFLAGALDPEGSPTGSSDEEFLGGNLLGAATGFAAGAALSKVFTPRTEDEVAVITTSAMGAGLGRGATMLLDESPGHADGVATLTGSLVGFGAGAAVQKFSPLEGPDVGALVLGAGFGSAVGALAPAWKQDAFPGWERHTTGGLLLGSSAGALAATAARHATRAEGSTVALAGLGAADGLATGLGIGMLLDGEGESLATRRGVVVGTLAGAGYGLALWPRLDPTDRDAIMMTGLIGLGGWNGYWASRLGAADAGDVTTRHKWGGLLAGAGGASVLATALVPALEVEPDLVGESLLMDLQWSIVGAGAGAIVSPSDDAPVWGLLGGGTAGLITGAVFHEALVSDARHAPLRHLGTLEGLWVGGWLPALLTDDTDISSRQRWGGFAAGVVGGRSLAVLASPFFAPDARTAGLAGVGSAIGAAGATGAALLGPSTGRSRALFAVGGSTVGLVGGGLLAPYVDFNERGASYALTGATLGAAEGLVFAWAGRAGDSQDYGGAALIGAGVGTTLGLSASAFPFLTLPRGLAVAGFGAWGAWMGSFAGALVDRNPEEVTFGGMIGANAGALTGYGFLRAGWVEPRDFGWLSLAGAIGTVAGGGVGAIVSNPENPRPILAGLAVGPLVGLGAGALILPRLRGLGSPSAALGRQARRAWAALPGGGAAATRAAATRAEGTATAASASGRELTSADVLAGKTPGFAAIAGRRLADVAGVGEWMPIVGALPSAPGTSGPPPFLVGVAGTLH